MKFSTVKEFPFSMETAWKALQDPAKLDVEPGQKYGSFLRQNGKQSMTMWVLYRHIGLHLMKRTKS